MSRASKTSSTEKFKPGQVIECLVESMTNQGAAIARVDGFVFFVPLAAPGDRIKAEIIKCKKSHGFAKLIEVLAPSPHRAAPRCEYFGRCGGCDWQHLSYERQLAEKKTLIEDAFYKIGNFKSLPEFQVTASPKEYNYRNRIQLQLRNGQPGYFAKGSHQLIKINHCEIAATEINQLLRETSFSENAKKVDIRTDLKGSSKTTRISHSTKNLPFQQVNDGQNSNLINYVQNIIANFKGKTVLDLYCGQGNFTFPMAEKNPLLNFIASDNNSSAIRQAQEKTQFSQIKNVQFLCEDSIATLKSSNSTNSLTLIDPPRTGCTEIFIDALNSSPTDQLIYISCDPTTLARDLKTLFQNKNWRIQSVQGFDMFPQTPHVETVVHAVRTN